MALRSERSERVSFGRKLAPLATLIGSLALVLAVAEVVARAVYDPTPPARTRLPLVKAGYPDDFASLPKLGARTHDLIVAAGTDEIAQELIEELRRTAFHQTPVASGQPAGEPSKYESATEFADWIRS